MSAEILRRAAEQIKTDATVNHERGHIATRRAKYDHETAELLEVLAFYAERQPEREVLPVVQPILDSAYRLASTYLGATS